MLHCVRFKQNDHAFTGVPDLVPDLEKFRYSLQRHSSPFNTFAPAITRIPMYYLQCALEENCLSSSAHSASLNDQRYIYRVTNCNTSTHGVQ